MYTYAKAQVSAKNIYKAKMLIYTLIVHSLLCF